MSGWTIITLRGRRREDYVRSREDDGSRYDATNDIAATMDGDERVHKWTYASSHVYGYLNCPRYDFDFAEGLLADYGPMVDDAVVLGANDTSDAGTARYYPNPQTSPTHWTDSFEEMKCGNVGDMACAAMAARHGIMARDPFHDQVGWNDEGTAKRGEALDFEVDHDKGY